VVYLKELSPNSRGESEC